MSSTSKSPKFGLTHVIQTTPPLDIIDLIPISEEAEFLFGKEISKHILSLENKNASHEFFPDEDFSEPFYKYLKLT